jgi:hypothetical protein
VVAVSLVVMVTGLLVGQSTFQKRAYTSLISNSILTII